QVLLRRVGARELPRRLEDEIYAQRLPRQIRRVLLRRDLDLRAVDDDRAVAGLDVAVIRAVHRVVLEQVRQRLRVGEVVHAHELDVGDALLPRSSDLLPPDTPEPVDPDPYAHSRLLWLPPVAQRRCPSEGHETNNACTAVAERGRARVQSRSRRHHVVDDDEMGAAERVTGHSRRRERARNVAETVPWCQPRLRLRMAHSGENVRPHGNGPPRCESARQELALIIAAVAAALSGERHRHERASLIDHVARPAEPRHALGQLIGYPPPPGVLERVDGAQADGARRPARAACRAHIRRKQRAPAALETVGRMSAPITAWSRELGKTRPTMAADHPFGLLLERVEQTVAHGTHAREQQVDDRTRVPRNAAAPFGGGGVQSGATALHITSRSGRTPNQRSNARAPCSTSMARPSIARCPRSRAARTNAVSFGRYTRSTTTLSGATRATSSGIASSCNPTEVALTTSWQPAITPTSSTGRAADQNRSQRRRARSGVRLYTCARHAGQDSTAPRTPAAAPPAPSTPTLRLRGRSPSSAATAASKPPTSVL